MVALVATSGYTLAQAPDSPRPAPARQAVVKSEDDSAYRGSIELKAVRLRKLDATLEKMAGPVFLKSAREPMAIEVQTVNPLPTKPRNTSAILIINGEKFQDTWTILPDKLVAFVDRGRLRTRNTAAAAWTGSEETSTSKRALVFAVGEIQ